MITKSYYEFIILVNLGDCIKDIKNLRSKLTTDYNFKIFETSQSAIEWLSKNNHKSIEINKKSLLQFVRDECVKIIKKYQPSNVSNRKFIDSFIWFLLINQKVFLHNGQIKVKSFINKKTGKKEVWVKVNKNTTNTDWENGWAIVKKHIDELPKKHLIQNKKYLQSDFETRLKIYKIFMRKKNKLKNKGNIYSTLYNSDEIILLMDQLNKKDSGLDALRKIIHKFNKDYSYLELLSPSEFN